VRTYYVYMNITLSIDEQTVERAREKLRASGKSINQEIRDHLRNVAGETDMNQVIEAFVLTSGQGHPESGWKFNRDEIYEERLRWPRK